MPVSQLPAHIVLDIKHAGYNRNTIRVNVSEDYSISGGGASAGERSLVLVLNKSGVVNTYRGDWGGGSIFVQRAADTDDRRRKIEDGHFIFKGIEGGSRPMYATLTINAHDAATLQPKTSTAITDQEREVIRVINGLKPSYREQGMRERKLGFYSATNPLIASLVAKGCVKVNRAGAISLTVAGRCA